jgi:hypothetical protein
MRNPSRKIAFVLASTDHGTIIVNRFDYRTVENDRQPARERARGRERGGGVNATSKPNLMRAGTRRTLPTTEAETVIPPLPFTLSPVDAAVPARRNNLRAAR